LLLLLLFSSRRSFKAIIAQLFHHREKDVHLLYL
jgi:hypothetical protein